MSEELRQSVRDRIWITMKSRMIAEARLKKLDWYNNTILVSVSVNVILLSVFEGKLSRFGFSPSSLSLGLSIVILVLSVLILGTKASQRASDFRSCYLELERLLAQSLSVENLALRFSKIKTKYPNHRDSDFFDLICERVVFLNQKIPGAEEISGPRKAWITSSYIVRRLIPAFLLFSSCFFCGALIIFSSLVD